MSREEHCPPVAPSGVRPEDVRVVVVNWRRPDETLDCLASLAAAGVDEAAVVVVDNGSGDESIPRIEAAFPGVAIVRLPQNRGFAGGANAGIERALEAGARAILLLNNDAQVAPDFLAPLLEAMNSGRIAAVCGAVFRADRPEALDCAYADVVFGWRYPVQIFGVNALPSDGFDRRQQVGAVIACCVLLRSEAIRRVGIFDEAYFAYHEDIDWSLRARAAGYRLLFEPYSRVFHSGQASTGGRWAQSHATASCLPGEQLPGAEHLPINPIRGYLGSRNLVRLVDRYATPAEKRSFLRACMRELPVEGLAAAMDRDGWYRLGRFGYREALQLHLDRHYPSWRRLRRSRLGAAVTALLMIPTLGWSLPTELIRAARAGRLTEWNASVRGLVDGLLHRPLPLGRLGLR